MHGLDRREVHLHDVGAVDTLIDVCGATLAHALAGLFEARKQIIALITQADVIRRISKALGLPADAPPRVPARSPPQLALPFA